MIIICSFCSCEQYQTAPNVADTEVSSITEEEREVAASTIQDLSTECLVLLKEIANANLELDHISGRIHSNKEFNHGNKANKSGVIELKTKIQSLKKYVEELKKKAEEYEEIVAIVEKLSRSLAEKEKEINRLYNEIDSKNSQIEALVEELRVKNALLENKNRELEDNNRKSYVTTGDALINALLQIPEPNKGLFKGKLSREIEVCRQGLFDECLYHYDQAIQLGSRAASNKKAEALELFQKPQTRSKQPAIQDDVYY